MPAPTALHYGATDNRHQQVLFNPIRFNSSKQAVIRLQHIMGLALSLSPAFPRSNQSSEGSEQNPASNKHLNNRRPNTLKTKDRAA